MAGEKQENPWPVPTFHFRAILDDNDEAVFQEVSGISVSMQTEDIKEGGENRIVHRVPGQAKYGDLVLKRGVMLRASPLALWCQQVLEGGIASPITPRTIKVALLDAHTNGGTPLMTWVFYNAYPIKWAISLLDAQTNEIMVESLSFTYSYFERL